MQRKYALLGIAHVQELLAKEGTSGTQIISDCKICTQSSSIMEVIEMSDTVKVGLDFYVNWQELYQGYSSSKKEHSDIILLKKNCTAIDVKDTSFNTLIVSRIPIVIGKYKEVEIYIFEHGEYKSARIFNIVYNSSDAVAYVMKSEFHSIEGNLYTDIICR
jgi:hypothetical protein